MLYLIAVLTAVYAFINAFGAWAVVRRKPRIAWLFMISAAVLVVAAVILVVADPVGLFLLATGLSLASLSSWLNARIVLGIVNPAHHLIRGALALMLFLSAYSLVI